MWDVKGYPLCPCGSSLKIGPRRAQEGSLYRVLLGGPVDHQGGRFVRECTIVPFKDGSQSIGYEVIPPSWQGYIFLEILPVGSVRGGNHRSEIFEGVDKTLRERKAHEGIEPY